jgi:aspartyl-tRNA(Asn)/glutamyl-tRNA(Gln) amidotransferase subunit B
MKYKTEFEAVIGLEIHAELETVSKMFCACPVVDLTTAKPNSAVCPVCSGMPGVLPVINQRAVEYALRVALALNCKIHPVSIFARKNYFYPDLPKGYQISQYEQPLATNGSLVILAENNQKEIRIRRVHLEEDTGKLTHVDANGNGYSLIDLNRAGVPLLEIVSEPDLNSGAEVRLYASALRSILRYLEVNSGDMQKGVLRIEPNVSVRPKGSSEFLTRTEIKNLNSFRALEEAVSYEIERQINLHIQGKPVIQQTLGWDEKAARTIPQRSKEEAHDYRYFPEPDLPPLEIQPGWIESIRTGLPELPHTRLRRFEEQYGLNLTDAAVLTAERPVADYFESAAASGEEIPPKIIANWISGQIFAYMNETGTEINRIRTPPEMLVELLKILQEGTINQNTAKAVLLEMMETGHAAGEIIEKRGLRQISDSKKIADLVSEVLAENPAQVNEYLEGKTGLFGWFLGQVMRQTGGKANPRIVKSELEKQLAEFDN